MRTVSSPSFAPTDPSPASALHDIEQVGHRTNGSWGLASVLLAAAVSALVVLADQMISTWADGHLLLGWVALWVVVFAGSALCAGTARRTAQATLRALDRWSKSLAEARAEARLWDLARTDPRLKAELLQARSRTSVLEQDISPASVAKNHSSDAQAPMGLDTGFDSPPRRKVQSEAQRQPSYLPYL